MKVRDKRKNEPTTRANELKLKRESQIRKEWAVCRKQTDLRTYRIRVSLFHSRRRIAAATAAVTSADRTKRRLKLRTRCSLGPTLRQICPAEILGLTHGTSHWREVLVLLSLVRILRTRSSLCWRRMCTCMTNFILSALCGPDINPFRVVSSLFACQYDVSVFICLLIREHTARWQRRCWHWCYCWLLLLTVSSQKIENK